MEIGGRRPVSGPRPSRRTPDEGRWAGRPPAATPTRSGRASAACTQPCPGIPRNHRCHLMTAVWRLQGAEDSKDVEEDALDDSLK